jgi:hypothetical protein
MVRTRKTKISEDEIWDVKQEWVKERKTAAKRFSSIFIICSSDEKSRIYIIPALLRVGNGPAELCSRGI